MKHIEQGNRHDIQSPKYNELNDVHVDSVGERARRIANSRVGLGLTAVAVLGGAMGFSAILDTWNHPTSTSAGTENQPGVKTLTLTETKTLTSSDVATSMTSTSSEPETTVTVTKTTSTASTETSSAETSGFTPVATNEKDGWARGQITLIDESVLEVDKLEYDPQAMKDGRALMIGAIVAGDIKFDEKFNTDSNGQTGQVTVNNKDGAVIAGKYGVQVYENFDPSKTALLVQTIESGMLEDGCGLDNGCKQVLKNVYGADGTFTPYTGSETVVTTETSTGATGSIDVAAITAGMSKDQALAALITAMTKANIDPNSAEGLALIDFYNKCSCPTTTVETTTSTSSEGTVTTSTDMTTSSETACADGFDTDLPNKYNGDLAKTKKDFGDPRDGHYSFTVKGGEKWAIQGDAELLRNGKLIKDHDGNGATGAVTYISVPQGESLTVYMLYGGDVHKLASCTTDAEAKQIVDNYVNGMVTTYGKGNVQRFDIK